jgi:hypothetical protein
LDGFAALLPEPIADTPRGRGGERPRRSYIAPSGVDVCVENDRPSPEYLEFLDEFLECRDDHRFNLIKNQLEQVIDREGSRIPEIAPLVERYKRGVMTFHIHGLLRLGVNGTPQGSHRGSRQNCCATVQGRIAVTAQPAGISNTLVLPNSGSGQVQASVFVDIRQVGKKSQGIIEGSYPVVGLHSLNDCKMRIGNPRKIAGEMTFSKRGCGVLRKSNSSGKLTMLFPLGINGGNVRVSLDEIEYQTIQGRPHLIDCFARQKRKFDRWRLGDVQLLFALRFFDDFVRFSSGVIGDASLERAEMFRSPDEFNFRRFEIPGHEASVPESGLDARCKKCLF